MFYMDDSGVHSTGWVVFSWIECTLCDWRRGLRAWLDLRKALYAQYSIPPAYHLHARKFIPGRGHPSTDQEWNRQKAKRGEVVVQALAAIADSEHLKVGTVYRRTRKKHHAYATEKAEVYKALVNHLEDRLAKADELGLVFMDGDGTNPMYRAAHRELKLDSRRVIEDPLFHRSRISQWIQMADLAAYTAYQGLQRHEGKEFMWDWYDQYLGPRDVNGGPLEV